jgi:hypothetical protein
MIRRIILLLFWSCSLFAQGRIVGYVVDATSNQPIAKANVFLENTRHGAVTDENGYFKIEPVPAGTYNLVVNILGYRKMMVQDVILAPSGIRALRVRMNREMIEMGDVKVTAKKTAPNFEYQASLAGHEMINPRTITKRPGAMEDAYRALRTVPGVVSRNDMNTQLYIRGSSPDQNLILYDGIEVTNPNRLMVMMGGGVSLVNPDILQAMELVPAGFEVDHGNKMSALVQIANREGSRTDFKFNASATLLNSRAVVEGPLAGGSGSWLIAVRRSFYDVLANAVTSHRYIFPFYYDAHAKVAYDFSAQHKLSLFYTHLGEGTKMLNVESEQLDLLNAGRGHIAGLQFTSVFSPQVVGHFFAGYYFDRNDINVRDTYLYRYQVNLDYKLQRKSLRSDIYYYPTPWLHFKFGGEVNDHSTNLLWNVNWRNVVETPANINFSAQGVHQAGYSEMRVKLKKWLEWSNGIRYDHSTLYKSEHWNPRSKLLITALHPISFWLSYGRFSQFPDFLTIIGRGEPMDLSQNLDRLGAEHATHAIVGGQWLTTPYSRVKLEIYRKDFSSLLVNPEEGSFVPSNNGTGLSQGVEVSFEKNRQAQERLGFWLNYTLAQTQYRRSAQSPWIYFEYDQTHQLNGGIDLRLSKRWHMEWVYYYGSGFPYTPVYGIADAKTPSTAYVIKGDKNSARYPYYSRLDLRLAYERTWSGRKWSAYLDVINVTNRRNVYLYDWRMDNDSSIAYLKKNVYYMLPLLPSVGMSLSL